MGLRKLLKTDPLTDVLEGLLQLGERCQAGLHDGVGPVVDLGVGVAVAADGALDGLLDDVGHLVHHELGLEIRKPQLMHILLNNFPLYMIIISDFVGPLLLEH